MTIKVGIDVGGTFTDFVLARDGAEPLIHKTLSTPDDPSIAVVTGLGEIAGRMSPPMTLDALVSRIGTIVHGTTVTTNATLTRRGAKTGLITTRGVRDALEMRRGIREEQYNNRYTNVEPLVPRYLRIGVAGRIDRMGREISPLATDEVEAASALFAREGVEAVSICFMNTFANPAHEEAAAAIVRRILPEAYLTVSSRLLPSIRFYERVSTTVLNSYIGPILDRYLDQLQGRLAKAGFAGVLLIMQSNGGVIAPDAARARAAATLLSGPAGGPRAGLAYAQAMGRDGAIVVDMGGTSFEAALVDHEPVTVTAGDIDRLRLALPMLEINTIGAGGGSIAWRDAGGLLRSGPQSAGADPGPAAYGKGGTLPATTDANIVLGYLDPAYFAGGTMALDVAAARRAIEQHIARPMGLSIEQAAAGIYRVACTNMAEGVREVTIKRGHDPREFPMIVAGGAGPIHSCEICRELEIPLQIVPRASSILCAAGMLMSDFAHDYVRTFVARLDTADFTALNGLIDTLAADGAALLASEGISARNRRFIIKLDCRYAKQYQEVSFEVAANALKKANRKAIAAAFHAEHNRLFGYSLEDQPVAIEIVNVRVTALGSSAKLQLSQQPYQGPGSTHARKGKRPVYVPERQAFAEVTIYDGHRLGHGNRVKGPAVIEQETTAIFVSGAYDCICDSVGSFVLYRKGREDLVASIAGTTGKARKAAAKRKSQ